MSSRHPQTKANKTDAGNGSKAICRVSNVLRSPSPDPKRWAKMMNFRVMLSGFFGLVSGCSTPDSVYEYPGGTFSVAYPSTWRATFDEAAHMANLIPPDETGAVTISAHHGMPPSEVDRIGSSAKPFGSAVTPKVLFPQFGPNSFMQEFEKETDDGRTTFIAMFVFHPEGTLIVSGNAPSQHFGEKRQIFKRILTSIGIRRK
jgi:hypothetical protein